MALFLAPCYHLDLFVIVLTPQILLVPALLPKALRFKRIVLPKYTGTVQSIFKLGMGFGQQGLTDPIPRLSVFGTVPAPPTQSFGREP